MARVEVDLPESFSFATPISVRIDDLNYGGHLGNETVLALAQEARARLLARHGWTELDVAGVGLIQVDAAVVYRVEGTWGMLLRAEVAVVDLRTRGCDFVCRLTDTATGQEIARTKAGVLFFDYRTRKVVTAPLPFRQAFAAPAPG